MTSISARLANKNRFMCILIELIIAYESVLFNQRPFRSRAGFGKRDLNLHGFCLTTISYLWFIGSDETSATQPVT